MPSFACTVYSKLYLPSDESGWSARPNGRVLERLHQMVEDEDSSQRWICVIQSEDQEIRIALGDPVPSEANMPNYERQLYVPGWLLESIGLDGVGEELTIRFERSEALPRARHLKFKLIGDVPEGFDIRELLETPLSELGIIRQGQIIPVPVLEGVLLMLEECGGAENDGYVFLDGAEVGLEIESDAPPPPLPVAPLPQERPPTPRPEETFETLLPPSYTPPVVQSSLPLPRPPTRGRASAPTTSSSGFVPFSGTGYRLDGK